MNYVKLRFMQGCKNR